MVELSFFEIPFVTGAQDTMPTVSPEPSSAAFPKDSSLRDICFKAGYNQDISRYIPALELIAKSLIIYKKRQEAEEKSIIEKIKDLF